MRAKWRTGLPSLKSEWSLIHRVIAFYLENQSDVDAMVAANDEEIARGIAAGPVAPSVVQLRQRLQQMRAATSNSG